MARGQEKEHFQEPPPGCGKQCVRMRALASPTSVMKDAKIFSGQRRVGKGKSTERPLHSRPEMPSRWEAQVRHTSNPGSAASVQAHAHQRTMERHEARNASSPDKGTTASVQRHAHQQTNMDRFGERGDDQRPTLANLPPTPLRHVGLAGGDRKPLQIW